MAFDECEHGSDPATCGVCRRQSSDVTTPRAAGQRSATPGAPIWDKYRTRYGNRPETFDAYVEVWQRSSGARDFPGGWTAFSRAANAEPAMDADLVARAEELMRLAGYEAAPKEPGVGRRWRRTAG